MNTNRHSAAFASWTAASIRRTCSCDTSENVAIRRNPHPSSRADTGCREFWTGIRRQHVFVQVTALSRWARGLVARHV